MTKLSVIIITFNEERNIGRCLQSVKEIADEIIVVDSFSTDETQIYVSNLEQNLFRKMEGLLSTKKTLLTH